MEKFTHYRNGEKARILCTDGKKPKYPIISMSECGDIFTHTKEGKYFDDERESLYDLIAEKKKHTVYINVWQTKINNWYATVQETKEDFEHDKSDTQGHTLISSKIIEIEEGEGL